MLSESSAYHKFASGQAVIIFGRPHIVSLQWPEGTCFLTNRISQAAYNKKTCRRRVRGPSEADRKNHTYFRETWRRRQSSLANALLHKGRFNTVGRV